MHRRLITIGIIAAALAVGVGTSVVLAAQGTHQAHTVSNPRPLVTKGGAPCAMATTAGRDFTSLPSSTIASNVVAVTITKRCSGPVTALLTAQSYAPSGDNANVWVGAKITCVGKGGFLHACHKGAFHWAVPAGQPDADIECLNCYANSDQAQAINLSWSNLPPGVYKVQVLGEADNSTDGVEWRTLQAIAWNKA